MDEFLGGKGYDQDEEYGDPPPAEQQTAQSIRSVSATTGPNPINPLFAAQGPLSELESSRYAYKLLKYPLDVEDNPRFQYYIKFNILMNIHSQYGEKLSFGDPSQSQTLTSAGSDYLLNRYEQVKVIAGVEQSQDVKKKVLSNLFKTQTVKTQQSISLYMPNDLNFKFTNSWYEKNVSGAIGKAGQWLSAASLGVHGTIDAVKNSGELSSLSVSDMLKKLQESKTVTAGIALLGEAVGSAVKEGGLGLAAVGLALNPNIEVLYKGPERRKFSFTFTFAPRNKREADSALTIVQMFKFHSAAEFYGAPDLGRFYVPPSQFDIEFVGRDGELWQLGKILPQCILTDVDVDYGASGKFSVFQDGTPTNIQLRLSFEETAFLTKEDVEKGF